MAPYELILRLDGALWLTIIFENPLGPKKGRKIPKSTKKLVFFSPGEDTTKLQFPLHLEMKRIKATLAAMKLPEGSPIHQ